jgi:hypothetical protein
MIAGAEIMDGKAIFFRYCAVEALLHDWRLRG